MMRYQKKNQARKTPPPIVLNQKSYSRSELLNALTKNLNSYFLFDWWCSTEMKYRCKMKKKKENRENKIPVTILIYEAIDTFWIAFTQKKATNPPENRRKIISHKLVQTILSSSSSSSSVSHIQWTHTNSAHTRTSLNGLSVKSWGTICCSFFRLRFLSSFSLAFFVSIIDLWSSYGFWCATIFIHKSHTKHSVFESVCLSMAHNNPPERTIWFA